MDGSLKKFIMRTMLATVPVVVFVIVYAVCDPFHVVHPVTRDALGRDSVIAGNNAGFVAVETFLAHNSERHYNSFILGSSMSQGFKASYWQPYLDKGASILHLDASGETIEGVINKIKFLDRHKAVIKNALIVIDEEMLRRRPIETDILYAQHPSTTAPQHWFNFHCIYLNAARNTDVIKKMFFDNIVLEKAQECKASSAPIANRIDIINENYYPVIDSLIEHAPNKFFTAERLAARKHISFPAQVAPAVNDKVEAQLLAIKAILDKNATNYIILIPPCNYKPSLMASDLWTMKAIFGQDKVHDFSRAQGYVNNELLYYDKMGHLISAKCKVLLDSAYREQSSHSLHSPFYRL